MAANLKPIHEALEAGDMHKARELLRPLLKDQPTADTWVLAARAASKREKSIECLRRALEIDPYHNEANRLLMKIEGATPLTEQQERQRRIEQGKQLAKTLPPLKKVRRKRPNWSRRILILVGILALGSSCSLFTLNMIGLVAGPVGVITVLTGGPTPIAEVNGKPLAEVDNAVMLVPASQSKTAQVRDADVLDNGYMHEYTFDALRDETVVVYIQFLSLTANRVSRNVAIVNNRGQNIAGQCERDNILKGDNNVAYTCEVPETGKWSVRVLGRQGESVGAYFIGVEHIQNFY